MKRLLTLIGLNVGIANADETLFAGTIVSEKNADTLVDYRNTNGAQATAESVDTFPELTTASEIGLRSPKFGEYRANGALTLESQDYNVFVERFSGDHLVRVGVLGEKDEIVGGFVGGKVDTNNFGLDMDVGYHSEWDLRGFVSVEPRNLYLSLGGNSYEQSLTSIIATTNLGKPGVIFLGNGDLDDNNYSGKIFLGDRFTRNKDFFDFYEHIKTGTQMERVTSGGVLDSWGQFDAYCSDRFSVVGDMSLIEEDLSLGVKGFYAIKKGFIFGVGFNSENTATFELFSQIPQTPLEAWVESNINTNTGETGARAYLGGAWSW
ncbi:hypothetical protein J4467_02650 [Candidatus Woesearchaeota archaeon]|nr:hypothetical protein [Candidatus Woesearchaeota archaeon]